MEGVGPMSGKVHVWYMTPDELEAYKKKHPIKPTKKERAVNFQSDHPDYKWRGEKGAKSRWGDGDEVD